MSYASPLETRIAKKVTKAISDYRLIEEGDRVMVGLSGGKDSWALFQILDVLPQARSRQLFAGWRHCGLRLRGLPARPDRQHVRAARMGVPHRPHRDWRGDGRPAGRAGDALFPVRPAAARRAVSACGRSRRDQDCAGAPPGRLHRNADAQPVLRRDAQGDAGEARVGRRQARGDQAVGLGHGSRGPSVRQSTAGCRSSDAAARRAATSGSSASA